jgi:hypothetical protein
MGLFMDGDGIPLAFSIHSGNTNEQPLEKKILGDFSLAKFVVCTEANPEKTRNGDLILAYECDPATADAEFLLSKAKYKAITGREQKRDNDCGYSIPHESQKRTCL